MPLATGEKVNASKYRQLPCRTFIAIGCCPYKDRCMYLHCLSIRSPFLSKLKIKRKNKEDITDSMFWPIMPHSSSTVENECVVPQPQDDEFSLHDTSLYSMWSHFVDVTKIISLEYYLPSLTSYSHAKAKRDIANSTAYSNIIL
jgi:hypothetical protein